MMDKNETQEHRRYCPECHRWVEEAELRARADGKLRHKVCDTVTAPGAPVPSEMHELAAQMAADEANEGNYTAAAELQQASAWERAAATPEPLFPCIRCHGEYPLVGGTLVAHDVPERCPGSGTVPVMFAEVATLKEPRLPVVGPFAAKHLVAEGAVEGRDYVVSPPLPADFALGQGTVGRWEKAEELAGSLAEAAAARVSTIDWSVLGPEVAAAVQARQHVWDAAAGSLRDCYCARGVDHTEEPLSELQAWMNAPRSGKTQIQDDIERAVATVDAAPAFRAPEPPIVSPAAVERALVEDIRGTFTAVLLSSNEQERLARQLVARGWVPGAKRRADAVTEEAHRG